MIKLEQVIISPTNNYRKMHRMPMASNKRWKHERKDLTKRQRIRLHAMLRAGCDLLFINSVFFKDYGIKIVN